MVRYDYSTTGKKSLIYNNMRLTQELSLSRPSTMIDKDEELVTWIKEAGRRARLL